MNDNLTTANTHTESPMKATLLLALAFFFISAPTPDAATLAEMSANFIIHTRLL